MKYISRKNTSTVTSIISGVASLVFESLQYPKHHLHRLNSLMIVFSIDEVIQHHYNYILDERLPRFDQSCFRLVSCDLISLFPNCRCV